MKSKLKLGIVVAIVALAIVGFAPRRANASYTSRAPISITADNQFTVGNGVTSGAGTSGDPYIIENWVINASGATGIHLSNTTAYVTIRNCLIENGGVTYSGIFLTNAQNVTISHNISDNNEEGIIMGSSSTRNTIDNNIIFGNDDAGIVANSTSYTIITNNTSYGNIFESIAVWYSSYDNITGNIADNSATAQGMTLKNDSNLRVAGNTISNNRGTQGIEAETLTRSSILGNTFDNNNIGLNLTNNSDNNLVENNTFSNNGNYGITVQSSSISNYIYLNWFLNNNVIPQASDGDSNYWDNDYHGNYWSDWQPPTHLDSDNNGVVDNWYPVWGSSVDHYPLVIGGVLTGVFTPNQPDLLKLDNQVSPARAKSLHPTFSFRYTDNGGENMTAFQIQVGPDNLVGDTIDGRWSYEENRTAVNGGTVSIEYSDNSINGINLNGPISLTRGTRYYWRVRTTDNVLGTSTPSLAGWGDWTGYLVGFDEWAAETFYTNQLPTCAITVDNTTHLLSENFHFYSNAHDNDNDNLTYHWAFGDNITSTQTNPIHPYSSIGNYNVTLYVSDPYESSVIDNLTVHVTSTSVNHAPTCTITYPLTGYSTTTGTSITFTCTASDPDNDPLTYLWDFGDGGTSDNINPTHTYSTAGSRGVLLTVSDGFLTGTDRITITITEPSGGGGGGGTPPVATAQPKTSSWGIPLWVVIAIAAAISYWRKIRLFKYQLAYLLIGLLVVLYIFAPSTANYQVITFTGTPPWGA